MTKSKPFSSRDGRMVGEGAIPSGAETLELSEQELREAVAEYVGNRLGIRGKAEQALQIRTDGRGGLFVRFSFWGLRDAQTKEAAAV